MTTGRSLILALFLGLSLLLVGNASYRVEAQSDAPQMLVNNLGVRTTVGNLITPIAMAFIGNNDFLVLEKNTGKVKRITGGVEQGTVLGIATHPNFPTNPGIYLYWTCRSTALPADPFFPDETRCVDANMFAADTEEILQVPLLGNRVDRFTWNGSSLAFDHNLIML